MDKIITYKPFGNQIILLEWKTRIDTSILKEIIRFKNKIEFQKKILYTDLIVGYNSLAIKYKKPFLDFSIELEILKSIEKIEIQTERDTNFIFEIPVCYDVNFGIDLEEISAKSGLSIDKIIKLHSERIYTIFFIGFLPGFLYLGGLNEQLFFDRKANPRIQVEKGSVAIGGQQTGVYPNDSAGGWNVIGKTPINFFDIENVNPCFAKAGDKVKFKPVCIDEFYQLEKEVRVNTYQVLKIEADA